MTYAAIATHLSITSERNTVVAFPGSSTTRSGLGVQVSLSLESTVLLTSSSKSTQLAVLVYWVGDPVNSRVVTNSSMGWVHHDNLKVLVHCILVYPVGVEHTEATTLAPYTFFGYAAEISGWLELGNTLVYWLSVHNSLKSSTSTSE